MRPLAFVKRWQVKFVVPSAGMLGLYFGGFLGIYAVSRRAEPMHFLLSWLIVWACAFAAGMAAMIATEHAIGESSSHTDLLRLLRLWMAAVVVLWLAGEAFERLVGVELPAMASHLTLWLLGVWSLWKDEAKAR